jgi:hypothetical protein
MRSEEEIRLRLLVITEMLTYEKGTIKSILETKKYELEWVLEEEK